MITLSRFPKGPSAAALITTALVCALVVRADESPLKDVKENITLAQKMIGTWARAGTPDKVERAPDLTRLKFITGKHWAVTQHDPKTGKVLFHHGGTYTLDGDMYTESVEYANESTADLIGQKFTFKVKVDGDS